MKIQDELKEYLISQGASDVGFCKIDDGDFGECRYGVSIVVRLSENIVDEIGAEWIQFLFWEDATYHGATKPVCPNY